MSEDHVLDSFKELVDYDDAARLLSHICPDSIRNSSENDLGSPESFACLLHRNPVLFDKLKDALALRYLEPIWDVCITYTQPRHSKRMEDIPEMLNSIASNLQELVNGRIDTPFWKLSTTPSVEDKVDSLHGIVEKIDLNQLMEKPTIPPMLFYDLGKFSNKENSIQYERLQKLFRPEQNTFLVNASATGKTRLLYEGLFEHWGIYITARADHLEAKALQVAMDDSFGSEEEMVGILPQTSALGFQELLDGNLRALDHRISKVLLVHLSVFKEFLKTAHTEGVVDDADLRRRWLIAQLSYPHLHRLDIYQSLLELLYDEPWANVEPELNKVIREIKPLFPATILVDGLFVVIDEANQAASQAWTTTPERHPIIRSIIRTWRDRLAPLGFPITFIVAGTEIASESFPSTSPEWSDWTWTSNTGSFDERELQKSFVIPFLPPSYAVTPSGEALIERIWNWGRPRHRLTSNIPIMLLQDKMAHPHSVLNKYIKGLMCYEASDGAAFAKKEGSSDVQPFFKDVGSLVAYSLLARSATQEVVFHYILTGNHPPLFGINRLELVTCGVGQFKDSEMQVIAMDQPGLTIAAAIWMNSRKPEQGGYVEGDVSLKSFDAFSSYFNVSWPDGDVYSPASYISWYISHAFAEGCPVSNVFAIPFPGWLKTSPVARLVILRKDEQGAVKEMTVGLSALLPTSPPLGYRATTLDDVVAWLNQERTGAFCICPPNCNAELIFVLKVMGKFVWVMLRTVGRSMQPEEVDMGSEFELLTESKLFSYPTNDATIPEKRLKETLGGLPNTLAPAGSFPVLRVLASFPTQLPLSRGLAQKINGGPVAVLNIQHMQQVTDAFSHHDIIEGLISSMHEKRSSYDNDAFSPVDTALKPVPKLRKGKRKDPAEETLTAPPKGDSSKPLNRLIRSIPRHMSRPSTPILETESGPSFSTGDDEVEDGQPRSSPSVPKPPKKARNVTKKGADTDILPRRRSTRNLKKKDNVEV